MVDIGITKFWISGPKSRSVNNSLQRPDFGPLNKFRGLTRESIYVDFCLSTAQFIKIWVAHISAGFSKTRARSADMEVVLRQARLQTWKHLPKIKDRTAKLRIVSSFV